MSTILNVSAQVCEQRVLMNHIRLREADAGCSSPRIAYDHGMLEIMSPSTRHEDLKVFATSIVELVAGTLSSKALAPSPSTGGSSSRDWSRTHVFTSRTLNTSAPKKRSIFLLILP